jgi:hypothetical protein
MYTERDAYGVITCVSEPRLRGIGRRHHGSKADDTEAAHIVSCDVLTTVLQKNAAHCSRYGSQEAERHHRAINENKRNNPIKRMKENRFGVKGSGDRACDIGIRRAMTSQDKRVADEHQVRRVLAQWEMVKYLDWPSDLKDIFRRELKDLRCPNGEPICPQ